VRIAIGSDHAGYAMKQYLVGRLVEWGHTVVDLGTDGEEAVDYPPYCAGVARAVVRGDADRGIVVGGSGQGEQLAANAVRGARAALCNDLYTARMSRAHNDANVLSLGGRVVGTGLADDIVQLWLATEFEGGRHARRVDQLGLLATLAGDPEAQDAELDTLVPGLTKRAASGGADEGASSR
jgi:ribose 5-phosphate isomerase B